MPTVGDIVYYITQSGNRVPAVVVSIDIDENSDDIIQIDRSISGYSEDPMTVSEGEKKYQWSERDFNNYHA